ncbi:hypothetical protein CY34DRAFT_110219 [Suillus luteus UH-Slu-Lm8-n1]|uniref:Uncharacterized protein n=1 Tax=Suillus luteus UH-Slu-Lm8-n1 TaxID=930992 RepID=A0A0D0A8Y0_9AGAM|nr:hypothetical protein CY34DRAFT_110219 [Suillus luteus UH-Slu-Lm8-n1]
MDSEDQSQRGTQLLEIYALEIQMHNKMRNVKKLKGSGIVHQKTLNAIRYLGPLRLVDLDYLSLKNQSDTEGKDGWFGKEGRLWLDCLPSLTVSRPTGHNYLAFDIIGDLAFGSPFGMTRTHEPVLGSPTLLPSPSMVLAQIHNRPSSYPTPNHTFTSSESFSPSEFAAPHQPPRSLSPVDSSPGLRAASISPAETSLRPPSWATQLWDSSQYEASSSAFPVVATVSVTDDRDTTVRRKKRLSTEELSREDKSDLPPLKSILKQLKLAPSAWQLYFTDWIQRHQATSTRKLNVAQAAKEAGQEYASRREGGLFYSFYRVCRWSAVLKEAREHENAAYMRSLTPDDIKKENAFRTAQRKAGRSRKSNIHLSSSCSITYYLAYQSSCTIQAPPSIQAFILVLFTTSHIRQS